MKHFWALFFIYILSFALISCNDKPEPIVIGATMSLSGALSTQGIAAANGYLLCEEHLNNTGGLLDREVRFLIYDDESNGDRAAALYEQLITEDNVDAIMGPYGSTLTEAVAPVTEKHRMVHISPLAATTSIWEQGREYLFMVLPPAEQFLAGLIELGLENGLSRVAILQEDALFPKAAGTGAAEMAADRGMDVIFHKTYERGTQDFAPYLHLLRDENIEVFGMAASTLDDFITITLQMKAMDVNVAMFGTSGSVSQFRDALGDDAEYVYGLSAWEPALDNPGITLFTEGYRSRFNMDPSFHAAGAYGSCQLFAEAVSSAGTLDAGALRTTLLQLEMQTVFSHYAVDERGFQVANSGLFVQWQDGQKVIVWPEEAARAPQRFPVPHWDER